MIRTRSKTCLEITTGRNSAAGDGRQAVPSIGFSTLDFVDAKHIYIGGHSRSASNPRLVPRSTIASPASSPPAPAPAGRSAFATAINTTTANPPSFSLCNFPRWVSPKVRFFTGRENLLPCDMHFEYALIAPAGSDGPPPSMTRWKIHGRSSGLTTWFIPSTNFSAPVEIWPLAIAPARMPDADTYHAHSEFLETVAAGKPPADLFPHRPIHVWDYQKWLAENKPDRDQGSSRSIEIQPGS